MAVAIFPAQLTDGTAQDLWEALQRDERWTKPATVSLNVDLNQRSRVLIGARFDDLSAAKAFRDVIGHQIVRSDLASGFHVELTGPPSVYVPGPEGLRVAPQTISSGGFMEVVA